jgi:hypothetical protein
MPQGLSSMTARITLPSEEWCSLEHTIASRPAAQSCAFTHVIGPFVPRSMHADAISAIARHDTARNSRRDRPLMRSAILPSK